MKVIYTGPYEGVEVPLPSGQTAYAERDKAIDVSADVAEGLLVQEEIWTRPKTRLKTNSKEAK